MKNDCFAINGDKCKILLDKAFAEYKKAGNCGSDGCPFYKPKGKEKTYKRGLTMKIMLDTWAYAPTRTHDTDAGLDIKAPFHFTLYPRKTKVVNTGVHVQLPENCVGLLQSKSGLNIKDSILSTGVIDEGYIGEIKVKLYNHGDYPVEFNPGDKISQLIVLPCRYEAVEIVDEIEEPIKCKDCERVRFDYHDKQYPCFCDKWLQGVKYNDYCSYGKRREDDESN